MKEGDYIDALTVCQMTEREFNNFRSYLQFMGYQVHSGTGEIEGVRMYARAFGHGFMKLSYGDSIKWRSYPPESGEEITLDEALRMAKLGEMVTSTSC